MKSVSTLFLKTAVFVLSLPMVLFCLFLIPEVGRATADLLPTFKASKYVVWALLYTSVIIYFIGLYQAFQLLRCIDQGKAFSVSSVRKLQVIKRCAGTISILHLCVLPSFYLFAEFDDAPGVIFVGLIVPFASLVIAVFAALLQRLLQEAIEMKSENELTI